MNIHEKTIQYLDNLLKTQEILPLGKFFTVSYFKSGGGTHLYLIESGNKKYLARFNYYSLKNEWGIKKHEFDVLNMIEPLQIAPKVYYFNDDNPIGNHFTIVEYIEGEPIGNMTDDLIRSIARKLKALHQNIIFEKSGDTLPPTDELPYHCGVYNEFAGGEDKQIEKYHLPDIERVALLYNEIKTKLGYWFNGLNIFADCAVFCLCHADLKKENILSNGDQAILIDWECAGVDIAETDIGRLFSGCELTEEEQQIFLSEYYPKNLPSEAVRSRIYAVKQVLDFFRIFEDYILLHRKTWDASAMIEELKKYKENFSYLS